MGDRPTTTIQIKGFPADLWREVGIEAKRRNITIREFVVEATRNKINREATIAPHSHGGSA